MGEANERGTFEERREEALWDQADVLVFLRQKDNKIHCGVMPQMDPVDQENVVVILASFVASNLAELLRMAVDAKRKSESAIPVPGAPKLIGPDGPVTGDVRILGVDGRVL